MPLLNKLFTSAKAQRHENRRAELYRDLIRREAKMGGELFGPIPKGHRREFFCLDKHTWIWHEEWTDDGGKQHIVTTRYDISKGNILKSQGNTYQKVSPEEGQRLYQAALQYRQKIGEMYGLA